MDLKHPGNWRGTGGLVADPEHLVVFECPLCFALTRDPIGLPVVQRLAVEKAAEVAAVIHKFIAVAPVMWHGDYPVKAVPVSDLLSALALAAAAQPGDGRTGE